MGFSQQKHWSGLPSPPPGDLPDPGIEPVSPTSPAFAGRFFTSEPPGKPSQYHTGKQILELRLMIAIHWTKHTFVYSSTLA